LLQGVGAGAQAYEGVQNQMLQRAKTEAETATGIAASTRNLYDANTGLMTYWDSKGVLHRAPLNQVRVAMAKGDPDVLSAPPTTMAGQPSTVAPLSGASMQAGIDSAPGKSSQAQTPDKYSYTIPIGKNGAIVAHQDEATLPVSDAERATIYGPIRQSASQAQAQKSQLLEMAATMGQPGGFLASGAAFDPRLAGASLFNTLSRLYGAPSDDLPLNGPLTQAQIAQKLAVTQAAAQAKGLGDRANSAISTLSAGLANNNLTPEAIRQIIADNIVANQRAIDMNAYADKYAAAHPTAGRMVESAFNADHTIDEYNNQREQVLKFISPIQGSNVSPIQYYKKIGIPNELQYRSLNYTPKIIEHPKNFGPGFYRYLGGTTL
jgi:hypothetical protein